MTEDSKKNVIDYITKNIKRTQEKEIKEFKEVNVIDSNFININDWNNEGASQLQDLTEFKYVGGLSVYRNNICIVLYGYYEYFDSDEDTSYRHGIITLLNEEYIPIRTILKDSDGYYLNPILCLGQAEDGTFFSLDIDGKINNFNILNDFSIPDENGEYNIIIENLYRLDTTYAVDKCVKMYKSPTSKNYMIFGNYGSSQIRVLNLKIEDELDPRWTIRRTSAPSGGFLWVPENGTPYVSFDANDVVSWKYIYIEETFEGGYSIKYLGKDGTASIGGTITFSPRSKFIYDFYFLSSDVFYFSIDNDDSSCVGLYKYTFSSSTSKLITNVYYEDVGKILIDGCDSTIYYCFHDENSKSYNFVRLINDNASSSYYKKINYTQLSEPFINLFFVNSFYNLISIFGIIHSDSAVVDIPIEGYLIKDNYNSSNYHGYPYVDYNLLIPYQVEMYSNNSLVFANDLQEVTVENNETKAVALIPNTYLNDIIINKRSVLSGTSFKELEFNNNISKNICENAYINFSNKINVYDDNNNLYSKNLKTSIYINKNINTGTENNYINSGIGFARIIYQNTSSVFADVDIIKINDYCVKIKFNASIDSSPIDKIEILSYDKNFVYIIINSLNSIPLNSNYTFEQYLAIGKKMRLDNIAYNEEQIMYDNNQVNAYSYILEEEEEV